jgi:small subunit ribosomal protein S18
MADESKEQTPRAAETATEAAEAAPSTTAAPATSATPGSTPTERPAGDRPRSGGYGGGPRRGPGGRPGGRGEGGGPRKFFRRKKVCKFCVEKIDSINYKDVRLLQGFVAERGKIVPRRLTGVCTPHQRRLSAAIKQARNIALLPFAARY